VLASQCFSERGQRRTSVRGGSGGGGIMRKVELFDPNSYGTRWFICVYVFLM